MNELSAGTLALHQRLRIQESELLQRNKEILGLREVLVGREAEILELQETIGKKEPT